MKTDNLPSINKPSAPPQDPTAQKTPEGGWQCKRCDANYEWAAELAEHVMAEHKRKQKNHAG